MVVWAVATKTVVMPIDDDAPHRLTLLDQNVLEVVMAGAACEGAAGELLSVVGIRDNWAMPPDADPPCRWRRQRP